jgi:hypothetical protein
MHHIRVVRNVVEALQLLHRLIIGSFERSTVEGFDFRQKLYYAPHVAFNGLAHMFIVMIGRLSYADPPEWLSMDLQADIEKLTGLLFSNIPCIVTYRKSPTEPARDLMDMIIEGPEGDSVWEAYQETVTQETQTECERIIGDEAAKSQLSVEWVIRMSIIPPPSNRRLYTNLL